MLLDLLPRVTLAVFGVVAVAIIVSGMTTGDPARLMWPDEGVRYFVLGTWLLLMLAIAGVRARRPAGYVLAALFSFGIVSTFVLTPHPLV